MRVGVLLDRGGCRVVHLRLCVARAIETGEIAESLTEDLYLVEEIERFETREHVALQTKPNDTIVTITATPTMTPIVVKIARSFAWRKFRSARCRMSRKLILCNSVL